MDDQLLSETFVELTDTMVACFDVIDFLHMLRASRISGCSRAGPPSPGSRTDLPRPAERRRPLPASRAA